MDCLSASGNAISDASDLSRARANPVLLSQPNGAGRRAHERPATDDRPALNACERHGEPLPCSFLDGFVDFANEPGLIVDRKDVHDASISQSQSKL